MFGLRHRRIRQSPKRLVVAPLTIWFLTLFSNRQFLPIPVFDARPYVAADSVYDSKILFTADERPQQMFGSGSLGKPENPFGPRKHCCSKQFLCVHSNKTLATAVTMTTIVGGL